MCNNNPLSGAKEMAQWLSVSAVLAGDLFLFPPTWWIIALVLGDLRSSSQLHGHYIYVLHIHTGGERLINYLSRMDFNEVKIS